MSSTLKKTLPVVLIVAGAFAVIVATKPAPAAPVASGGNSGALVAENASHDFGRLPLRSGLARTTYRVTNAGSDALTIRDVWTSCMCTTAVIRRGGDAWGPFGMPGHGLRAGASLTLAPGDFAEVEAIFDPAAHGPAGVGPVMRSIFIDSTAGEPLELAFTATVTP